MPGTAALLVYDFLWMYFSSTDQQILFDIKDEFESLCFTNMNVDLLWSPCHMLRFCIQVWIHTCMHLLCVFTPLGGHVQTHPVGFPRTDPSLTPHPGEKTGEQRRVPAWQRRGMTPSKCYAGWHLQTITASLKPTKNVKQRTGLWPFLFI